MKLRILFAVILLQVSSAAMSQNLLAGSRNEFSVSYGAAPSTDVVTQFTNCLAAAFTLSPDDNKCFGVINFDYNHRFLKWFSLGINLSYSRNKTDNFQMKDGINTKYCTDKSHFYTIMPTFKFNWFNRKFFSMYSRISAGVTLESEKLDFEKDEYIDDAKKLSKSEFYFNGQISPLGLELGPKFFRVFAEFGFGQCGVVQAGARLRL